MLVAWNFRMFRFLILRHGRWYLSFKMKLEKKNAIIFPTSWKRLNEATISVCMDSKETKLWSVSKSGHWKRKFFEVISFALVVSHSWFNWLEILSHLFQIHYCYQLKNTEYVMQINKIFCTRRYFNTYFLKH